MLMALYPMHGQRAIFIPPPLPMRSLSLHAVRSKIKTGLHRGREHRVPGWWMVSIRDIALSNAYDGRVADVHFGLATLQDLGGVTAGTKPRNETHSVLHLKQAAA